jgi:hypothetical protein
MEKRKSSTIIKDEGAYELIEGIENMELFLLVAGTGTWV